MEQSQAPSMDLSKPSTHANLEAAFGGESMANRKYLFFSEVAKQLGHKDLAKLFRDTAAQETEHAFAHFRLLHPELVVSDPEQLSDEQKQAILSRCLELDTSPAEQPLLPDALAWLDGKVSQRMECGDHWLIYAEVDRGGVLDAEGSTAVHQRRSGANY